MRQLKYKSQTKFSPKIFFITLAMWLSLSLMVVCPTAAVKANRVLLSTKGEETGDNSTNSMVYLPVIINGTDSTNPDTAILTREELTAQVINGEAGVVRGTYIQNVLALRVMQQPVNDPNYVSPEPSWLTQYGLAEQYNVIGLLAHNSAAGKDFFNIKQGELVSIIYGDGKYRDFKVTEIHQFQALQPNSTSSSFLDLETGETLSAGKLFVRMYRGNEHVTFQTCIARDGNNSWGRLFVIAVPISN